MRAGPKGPASQGGQVRQSGRQEQGPGHQAGGRRDPGRIRLAVICHDKRRPKPNHGTHTASPVTHATDMPATGNNRTALMPCHVGPLGQLSHLAGAKNAGPTAGKTCRQAGRGPRIIGRDLGTQSRPLGPATIAKPPDAPCHPIGTTPARLRDGCIGTQAGHPQFMLPRVDLYTAVPRPREPACQVSPAASPCI